MGIYRDRNNKKSCSFVCGNTPKVCRKQSSENHQKENQQISKQEVCFLEKGILGQKRHLGKRVFLSTVGIDEEVIRRYVESQEEEK